SWAAGRPVCTIPRLFTATCPHATAETAININPNFINFSSTSFASTNSHIWATWFQGVIPDLRRPHPHSRLRRNRHSLGKSLACCQSDDSDGLHSEPLFVGHLAPRGGLGFEEWSCALLLQPK